MEKDARKRLSSLSPCDMIKKRNFINVLGFPGLIQRRGLNSWSIKIVWDFFSVD